MSAGRTVVLLEDAERGGLRIKLVGSPRGESGPSRAIKLDGLPELVPGEVVARYGEELLSALRGQREVREAFEDALRAGDDVRPICFKVDGPRSEELALCWELLWDSKARFLALDPRWPITRIAATDDRAQTRTFRSPLRIVAVMSALGEEARPEWLGLQRAVLAAREQGLEVRLTAVVGEQALLDELRTTAQTETWLDVVALESKALLTDLLTRRPPQILHFFCHGWTGAGEGRLELATIGDRAEAPEDAKASVAVSLAELRRMAGDRKYWLVTLNCCSGARSTGEVQSIAQTMVSSGAAAAIGWREPVDARDANALSATLYLELLGRLSRELVGAEVGDQVELDLASASYGTRDELRTRHGDDSLVWTLPVLYLPPTTLSVTVLPPEEDREEDAQSLRASTTAQVLADAEALMRDAPASVHEKLRARIARARDEALTRATGRTPAG